MSSQNDNSYANSFILKFRPSYTNDMLFWKHRIISDARFHRQYIGYCLFHAIIACGACGCTRDVSSSLTARRLGLISQITKDDVLLIDIWHEVAAVNHLSREDREAIDNVLEKHLRKVKIKSTGIQEVAFRRSLAQFIESNRSSFAASNELRPLATWLAYCMVEAMKRPKQDKHAHQEIAENIVRLDRRVCNQIEKQLRDSVPPGKDRNWNLIIRKNMAKLQATLDRSILDLADDQLYPGFKRPFTEEDQNEILHQVGKMDLLGIDYRQRSILETKDEYYRSYLVKLFQQFGPLYAYMTTMVHLRADLIRVGRWSTYVAKSQNKAWPVSVLMYCK